MTARGHRMYSSWLQQQLSRQVEPLLARVKQTRPSEYVTARDEAVLALREALDLAIADNGLSLPDWSPWMTKTAYLLAKLERLQPAA